MKEGLFKPNGFTDEKVCGDVRFKLVEVLRNNGLAHSTYASTLMKSMEASVLPVKNLQASS